MHYSLAICCPFLQFDSSVRRSIQSFLHFKDLILSNVDIQVGIMCVTSNQQDLCNEFLIQNSDAIVFSPPKGVYSAFNDCIQVSLEKQFDWIWIVGAGDTIILHEVDALIDALHDISSPICMSMLIGDRKRHPRMRFSFVHKFLNLDKMRINHPTAIIPSRIYRQYGLYSLEHRVVSDFRYVHELLASNIVFRSLPALSVYHELGGVSTSVTKFRLSEHIECLRVIFSIYHFSIEFCFAFTFRLFRYAVSFLKTRKL